MCDIINDFINIPFVTSIPTPDNFTPVDIDTTNNSFTLRNVVVTLLSNSTYVNGLRFTIDSINGFGPANLAASFPIEFSGRFLLQLPGNVSIAVMTVTIQLGITVNLANQPPRVTSYVGITGNGYLSFFGSLVGTLISYPSLNVCDPINKAYNELTTVITSALTNNYSTSAVDTSALCFALDVPAKLAVLADKMNKVCLGQDSSSSDDTCKPPMLPKSSGVTKIAGFIKSLTNLASTLSPTFTVNGGVASLSNITAILNAKIVLGQLKEYLECNTFCESSSSTEELTCLNPCKQQGSAPDKVSKLEKAVLALSNAVKENQKQVNQVASYIYKAKAKRK